MKRLFIAVSCVALLLTAYDSFAQDAPKSLEFPTGTMTLSAPESAERAPTLSPVLFPHSLHFSYSCKDCHHDWNGAEPVKGCASSGCHERLWAPKPGTVSLDARRVKSLAGAYHENCRDCHRKEAAGPVACDECHPTPPSEPEHSDETMSVPLGNMILKAPEGVEAKRGDVDFPHGLHFQFACQSCHHDWDGESEIENCTSCHSETEPNGARNIKNPDNVMYFLAAYHNVCVGCHRDMDVKRQDQIKKIAGNKAMEKMAAPVKAGPVNCTGCHS